MHDDRAGRHERAAQNPLPHGHDVRSGLAVVAIGLSLATLAAAPQAPAYRETIPGTTVTFEMVPVPAGDVSVAGKQQNVAPFRVGRTEVTWDMYDVFALGLDTPASQPTGADAVARPSNPYGAPDYGWGHAGYPVISVTRAAAEAFAKWLSQKTGRVYRLPTEAEWTHLATLAAGPDGRSAERIDVLAWHRDNASARTHPVAEKRADRLGLFDLFGNAAEWVATGDDSLVVRGGSFRDRPDSIGLTSRSVQDDTWNERDPQLPKSRWWLSDAPFVGFRLVEARIP
jgi:formylglycine-generating enzyme required for sulfatase activity